MAAIKQIGVLNARQIDASNWMTMAEQIGPVLQDSPWPSGDCTVEVSTQPNNDAAEWAAIEWVGGVPILGQPNRRLMSRFAVGKTNITASLGGAAKKIALWVIWADVRIITDGPKPSAAVPWGDGAMFTEAGRCGAFVVGSLSMGENARGQVVAAAKVKPMGIGRALHDAKMLDKWKFRREVTSHDFVDGRRYKHKKSFVSWQADDSPSKMQAIDMLTGDSLYDTDGPDLTSATSTSETYNNFRQWVEWDGFTCSPYAHWYFKARWQAQKVTLKEVGAGSITLPARPHYQ